MKEKCVLFIKSLDTLHNCRRAQSYGHTAPLELMFSILYHSPKGQHVLEHRQATIESSEWQSPCANKPRISTGKSIREVGRGRVGRMGWEREGMGWRSGQGGGRLVMGRGGIGDTIYS